MKPSNLDRINNKQEDAMKKISRVLVLSILFLLSNFVYARG